MKNNLLVTPSEDGRVYDFVVETVFEGKRIAVQKQVLFETSFLKIGDSEIPVTNMALVDILPDGSWSDSARSGHGKTTEILATVAECLRQFYEYYPDEVVYFEGSNPDNRDAEEVTRTRLYRRALSKSENYELLTQYVDLYGISGEGEIFGYLPNSKCVAFVIKLKK